MLKHMKRIVSFIALFVAVLSLSAYASDVDVEQDDLEETSKITINKQVKTVQKKPALEVFLDEFKLTLEETADTVMDQEAQAEFIEALNIIGDFVLSSGFDSERTVTFSKEKNLVGRGLEGMTIGVIVFDEAQEVTYSSVETLGASGLYNETISFAEDTEQHVMLVVKDDDVVNFKVFNVKTIHEKTKMLLENIEIDFTETEEVNDIKDDKKVDSFVDWFGANQEFGF